MFHCCGDDHHIHQQPQIVGIAQGAQICSCCLCSFCLCFSSPWFLVVVHVPFHRSFKLLFHVGHALFPLGS
jgi:hypothetical protein